MGSKIWRVPASQAGDAQAIDQIGESITSMAFCPRKNRLVYAKGSQDANIWRLNLDPTLPAPAARDNPPPTQFIASTWDDSQPQFSPDGKFIAYHSDRSGYPEIWVANSDGSGSHQLTRMRATISAFPRWSPDNKQIVFHSRPAGYANIYVVNVETGAKGADPNLWTIPVEGGTESRVPISVSGFDTFTVGKRGIYFERHTEGLGGTISFMSFSGQRIRDLANIKKPFALGLTVSPDERSILYTQIDQSGSDIFMVENFR